MRKDDTQSTPLKTPFGTDAFAKLPLIKEEDRAWNGTAWFKAYQAYIRAELNLPISVNKGVFCSQFVSCCYQAAAIKIMLSDKKYVSIVLFKCDPKEIPFTFQQRKHQAH
ncbi:hypothetical protein DC094_13635 [Pelagibaculum spongiae]|uniref:Uncharacterized protein n=2 Tax=Pelagibaculum spongiae TaxID=2080658 RepID=A0A2V1GSQ3_9GAMM|nr:hypothetical protein DC094_13635 [Pelagibaculum spongiae]